MKAVRILLIMLCALSCSLFSVGTEVSAKNKNANKNAAQPKVSQAVGSQRNVVTRRTPAAPDIDTSLLDQEITPDEFNKNKVKYGKLAEELGRKIGDAPDDLRLWAQANYELRRASALRGVNINVDVDNGVVSLSGSNVTQDQKSAAEQSVANIEGVANVNNNLQVSNANTNTNTNTNTNIGTNTGTADNPDGESWLDLIMRVAYYLLISLAVVALLGGIAYGIWYLRKKAIERIEAYFAAVRERQKQIATIQETAINALGAKLDTLRREQHDEFNNITQRLGTLRTEVDALRRGGGVGAAVVAQPSYESAPRFVEEKPAPAFPVSAEEFLSKLGRSAVSVKFDSLNEVLVRDQDSTGEFVLVPDDGVPDGLLYIVPRVKRFTTRQDFHSYYEKFYDCYNPSAGEVWIIEPTTVKKVNGGWKLGDKGVLEVRR